MAKSARPWSVCHAPPEQRCWTLTGQMVRPASLLETMSRPRRAAKRRTRSSKARNRPAMRPASFAVGGASAEAGRITPALIASADRSLDKSMRLPGTLADSRVID